MSGPLRWRASGVAAAGADWDDLMMRIGFVGAGNMARALGGGLARVADVSLCATDPLREARTSFVAATGGRVVEGLAELLADSDVVVLAVKPQVLPGVLADMRSHLGSRHLVLSIVAGATLGGLGRGLGDARLVRAMPNTPALVGHGMTVLVAGARATPEDRGVAERVFESVGKVEWVDDEALLDPVTAVSGSGPGFLFAYAEAMLDAARGVGLPSELAVALVRQTVLGSAILWQESGESVEVLRERVTSPGGTTQAGLAALEARDFAGVIRAAVEAATRRSRELAEG